MTGSDKHAGHHLIETGALVEFRILDAHTEIGLDKRLSRSASFLRQTMRMSIPEKLLNGSLRFPVCDRHLVLS